MGSCLPDSQSALTEQFVAARDAKNPGAETPGSFLVLPAGRLAQPLIRRSRLIVGSDPYGVMLPSGRRLFRISRMFSVSVGVPATSCVP